MNDRTLDEGVREALKIVIDTSIPSGRLVRELEQLVAWRGPPQAIRCDNGPEICAQAFVDWCRCHGIEIRYIQPGKPNQNAFIERFNKTYRDEVLEIYLFTSLDDVRRITEEWLPMYNEYRPHDSLGRVPPAMFKRRQEPEISSSRLSTGRGSLRDHLARKCVQWRKDGAVKVADLRGVAGLPVPRRRRDFQVQ